MPALQNQTLVPNVRVFITFWSQIVKSYEDSAVDFQCNMETHFNCQLQL